MTSIPYEVAFHGMDRSEHVERWIEGRLERLGRHHDRVQRCRVVVDSPHNHKQKGGLFEVRIDLTTRGDHVAAARGNTENHAYEDVYVALRDAFDAVERSLDRSVDRLRHDVKAHTRTPSQPPLAARGNVSESRNTPDRESE